MYMAHFDDDWNRIDKLWRKLYNSDRQTSFFGGNAMTKVWFITGAGKGIGRETALSALKNGHKVVITTRKEIEAYTCEDVADRVLYYKLDVSDTDEKVFSDAVAAALNKFGRIDVLVNNAGHGRITNFEETSEDSIKELFEVNLFGMMRVTRAILPIMRKQRSGHIFNISSGGGYAAGPAVYHTSKFAVTGFSTSIAFETAPFGIKVTNVIPGLTRTNFYDKGTLPVKPDIHISDYDDFRWQTDFMAANSNNEQPGDPAKIADLLMIAAECENPPLHLPVTADAVEVLDRLQEKLHMDNEAWRTLAKQTSFE